MAPKSAPLRGRERGRGQRNSNLSTTRLTQAATSAIMIDQVFLKVRRTRLGTYRFIQLDVFTDHAFGGNPLAVFPDAEGITDEEMQQIAREMNLSETVFVLPSDTA